MGRGGGGTGTRDRWWLSRFDLHKSPVLSRGISGVELLKVLLLRHGLLLRHELVLLLRHEAGRAERLGVGELFLVQVGMQG